MRYLPALIVDVVFVLVFAVIGRASHEESPAEFLLTAWPFLVALLVGHLLAAALPSRPRRPWSLGWGVVVWLVTVVGGLLLRVASGDTAQIAFIIVATLVLGVLLVGWRAMTALLRRRRLAGADATHAGDSSSSWDSGVAEGAEAEPKAVLATDVTPGHAADEAGDRALDRGDSPRASKD